MSNESVTLDCIQRITRINIEAAAFMLQEFMDKRRCEATGEPFEGHLAYGDSVDRCYTWHGMPQGSDFWRNIHRVDRDNREAEVRYVERVARATASWRAATSITGRAT